VLFVEMAEQVRLGERLPLTTTMYAHVVPSMKQGAADTMDGVLASAG
jgi:hypothetical protein